MLEKKLCACRQLQSKSYCTSNSSHRFKHESPWFPPADVQYGWDCVWENFKIRFLVDHTWKFVLVKYRNAEGKLFLLWSLPEVRNKLWNKYRLIWWHSCANCAQTEHAKVNESHCPLPRTWSFRLRHICDTKHNICNVLKLTRFCDIIKRLMILPNLMICAVSSTGKRVETFLSCIFTESTTEQSLDVTTAEQDRLSEPLDTTSVFDDGTTVSDAVTSTSDTLIADVATSTSDTSTGEFPAFCLHKWLKRSRKFKILLTDLPF